TGAFVRSSSSTSVNATASPARSEAAAEARTDFTAPRSFAPAGTTTFPATITGATTTASTGSPARDTVLPTFFSSRSSSSVPDGPRVEATMSSVTVHTCDSDETCGDAVSACPHSTLPRHELGGACADDEIAHHLDVVSHPREPLPQRRRERAGDFGRFLG